MLSIHILPILLVSLAIASAKPSSRDESSEEDTAAEQEAMLKLKQAFEEQCIQHSGSNVTYDEVIGAMSYATGCILGGVNFGELVDGWMRLSQDTRQDYFARHCEAGLNATRDCLRPLEELSRQCVRPGGQRVESPDFPLYVVPQVVEVVCEGDGAVLFANNVASPTECFENYFTYIQDCMVNFSSKTNGKTKQNYAENECKVLKASRMCVKEKLTNCGNPDLIRLLDVPYETIIRETACKDFIQLNENH